jgi:hypothetical protein
LHHTSLILDLLWTTLGPDTNLLEVSGSQLRLDLITELSGLATAHPAPASPPPRPTQTKPHSPSRRVPHHTTPHQAPRQSIASQVPTRPEPIRKDGLPTSGSGGHGGGGPWPAQPRRGPVMGLPQRRLLREARADRRGHLRVTSPSPSHPPLSIW